MTTTVTNGFPAYDPITIDCGGTFEESWVFEQQDPDTGVITPVDLSGFTATMKVKVGSKTVLSLSSTGGSPAIVLGSNGSITITIPSTTTATLTPDNGVYDFILSNSDTPPFVIPLKGGPALLRKLVSIP